MKKHVMTLFLLIFSLVFCSCADAILPLTAEDEVTARLTADTEEESPVRLPSIFKEYAVLQRDLPIRIFGYADAGVKVTVTLGENSAEAVTGSDGKWTAELPAMAACREVRMEVSSPVLSAPIVREHIAIGEVYLCSGQSNMQFAVNRKVEGCSEYMQQGSFYDNIRLFNQPQSEADAPLTDMEKGAWYEADEKTLLSFSAIGYITATILATEMPDMVFGMIFAAYGGSGIQTWIDADTLRTAKEQGLTSSKIRADAGTHYNSMVAPFCGIALRGVLWYQGEANSGLYYEYRDDFAILTKQWRTDFCNADMTIVTIQLAPYVGEYQNMRAVQYDIARSDPNIYLVSTAIDGPVLTKDDINAGFVHPTKKASVAQRIATLLLYNVYGIGDREMAQSPDVTGITTDRNALILTFDRTLGILYGNRVTGFELYEEGVGWRSAVAAIDGNRLTLTASGVSSPTSVRYGWADVCIELEDGRVYTKFSNCIADKENNTMTLPFEDGTQNPLVFVGGKDDAIHTTLGGNLTGISGYPVPAFVLRVGADANHPAE